MNESPPDNLADIKLTLEIVPAGKLVYRIYFREFDHETAFYFGKTASNRFDDHRQEVGVCYAAFTLEGAFVETMLRGVQDHAINDATPEFLYSLPHAELDARSIAAAKLVGPLRLVKLYGDGLLKNRVDASIASCPHAISRLWATAFMDHPDKPDGLIYACNHNNSELAVALFDRATAKITTPVNTKAPLSASDKVWELLDLYTVAITLD